MKGIDGTRNGYLKLGEILVNEGKLSDEDMIFFLTHGEIGQLIKERSSRIINR